MYALILSLGWLLTFSCEDNNGKTTQPACNNCEEDKAIEGVYNPSPYALEVPEWFPKPIIPDGNQLTVEGVKLGRQLFYDPILSSDGTISCASCHSQDESFADPRQFSVGVLGIEGNRNAMALVNLAYNPNGFFWDGRSNSLEDQIDFPITDHTEMNEDWDNIEEKLRNHSEYPALFRSAFGISKQSELTRDLVMKAIAQFERTLISGYSRYDQIVWQNNGWPTDSEERGRKLFFVEPAQQVENHPGCSHCHGGPFFTDNFFKNNGLDSVATLDQFSDSGRGGANGNVFDNGKFRVPTLRNIALTAPYMHDGRFKTLDEVIEHYSRGGHGVENEDVNIRAFPLTEQNKQDLIAFLNMLTDTTFLNNPEFSNPFE